MKITLERSATRKLSEVAKQVFVETRQKLIEIDLPQDDAHVRICGGNESLDPIITKMVFFKEPKTSNLCSYPLANATASESYAKAVFANSVELFGRNDTKINLSFGTRNAHNTFSHATNASVASSSQGTLTRSCAILCILELAGRHISQEQTQFLADEITKRDARLTNSLLSMVARFVLCYSDNFENVFSFVCDFLGFPYPGSSQFETISTSQYSVPIFKCEDGVVKSFGVVSSIDKAERVLSPQFNPVGIVQNSIPSPRTSESKNVLTVAVSANELHEQPIKKETLQSLVEKLSEKESYSDTSFQRIMKDEIANFAITSIDQFVAMMEYPIENEPIGITDLPTVNEIEPVFTQKLKQRQAALIAAIPTSSVSRDLIVDISDVKAAMADADLSSPHAAEISFPDSRNNRVRVVLKNPIIPNMIAKNGQVFIETSPGSFLTDMSIAAIEIDFSTSNNGFPYAYAFKDKACTVGARHTNISAGGGICLGDIPTNFSAAEIAARGGSEVADLGDLIQMLKQCNLDSAYNRAYEFVVQFTDDVSKSVYDRSWSKEVPPGLEQLKVTRNDFADLLESIRKQEAEEEALARAEAATTTTVDDEEDIETSTTEQEEEHE